MHTGPTTPDLDELTAPERLLELVGQLPESTLICFEPTPSHLAVHLRPLEPDDRCAAAALFGVRAEPSWCAAAVHLEGTGRDLHTGRASSERAVASLVVHRDGRCASSLSVAGGAPERVSWNSAADPPTTGVPEGLFVDGLHRVLARPSPGVAPGPEQVVLVLWCVALSRAASEGRELTWADAVRLHPADPGPARLTPSPEMLTEATRRADEPVDWERLRRRALQSSSAPDLSPDEVAWMDDTMFARWMLGSFEHPRSTLELLERSGHRGCAEGLRRVLDELDPPRRSGSPPTSPCS